MEMGRLVNRNDGNQHQGVWEERVMRSNRLMDRVVFCKTKKSSGNGWWWWQYIVPVNCKFYFMCILHNKKRYIGRILESKTQKYTILRISFLIFYHQHGDNMCSRNVLFGCLKPGKDSNQVSVFDSSSSLRDWRGWQTSSKERRHHLQEFWNQQVSQNRKRAKLFTFWFDISERPAYFSLC